MLNIKSNFLDGRLLEIFYVVAEELHFGQAASRLCMSQPALSQQIKKLESKVGTPLFIRTTRTVHLTSAGEVMFRMAEKIGGDTAHMLRQVKQAGRGVGGYLKVGLTPTASCSPVASGLHFFRSRRPEIELDLLELNSVQMPAALRMRTVDVALMRPTSIDADIHMTELYTEPMLVAIRADDALAKRRSLTLDQIARRPLISYRRDISPYFRQLLNTLFSQAGMVPNVVQESIIPTLLTLVEAGVGLAIVPESLIHSRGKAMKFIPLSGCDHIRAATMVAELADQHKPIVSEFVSMMKEYQAGMAIRG